jgi:predicted dehydrogenase
MGLLHGAILGASGTVQCVALVELSRKTRFLTRTLGIPARTYPSLDRALSQNPTVSQLFVCTPPRAHAEQVELGIERKLKIFVEKPFTHDAELSRALAQKASRSALVGCVGFVRRFQHPYSSLAALIRSQGGVESISATTRSRQFVGQDPEGAHRGGLLHDLTPHMVDLALWLADGFGHGVTVGETSGDGIRQVGASLRVGTMDVRVSADWANPTARKVESEVVGRTRMGTTFRATDDALEIRSTDEQPWQRITHARDAPPPFFDVAGPEYSRQFLDVQARFRGEETATCATFEQAAVVDGVIKKMQEAVFS